MNKLRRLFFSQGWARTLLEAGALAIAALALVMAVVRELPQGNIMLAFLFLTQLPVGWAALRLRRPSGPSRRRDVTSEIAFGLALRAVTFLTAWGLAVAWGAQEVIGMGGVGLALNLAFPTATLFPYLAYRAIIALWRAWRRLASRSLLWTLVDSHLTTVSILAAGAAILARLAEEMMGSSTAYYPPSLLATVVLEFVRSIIPWMGVSVILIAGVLALFFLPTTLVSYFVSRRLARRIRDLAEAMARLRRGDPAARVAPSGRDEIAQLQEGFNHMAAELQSERDKVALLLKNQRELAAVVSHELRTPISVMRAYIENNLSEDAALPDPYRQDMEVLRRETLKLQDLVEDLFTLSQADARRLSLECAWVQAGEIIAHVAASAGAVAWESKRIALSTQAPPDLPPVWADPRRLEQALGNLAQNAIRHTPAGGVIIVRAEPTAQGVEISVRDSGEGIAPADQPHIWERFYRGAQGGGSGRTGIGLALVQELVESMGGSVGVESQPGEGSRFWVRLNSEAAPSGSG